jgi:hypothetical protein
MTKSQFFKAFDRIPLDDPEITIGKVVVIDEKRNLTGILRLEVSGFCYDATTSEVHFLLDLENVKQVFWPSEVTLFKDIPAAEHGFHNPIHHLDEEDEDEGEIEK